MKSRRLRVSWVLAEQEFDTAQTAMTPDAEGAILNNLAQLYPSFPQKKREAAIGRRITAAFPRMNCGIESRPSRASVCVRVSHSRFHAGGLATRRLFSLPRT